MLLLPASSQEAEGLPVARPDRLRDVLLRPYRPHTQRLGRIRRLGQTLSIRRRAADDPRSPVRRLGAAWLVVLR